MKKSFIFKKFVLSISFPLVLVVILAQYVFATNQPETNSRIDLHGSVFFDLGPEIWSLFHNGYGFGVGAEIGFDRFSVAIKTSFAQIHGNGDEFTTIESFDTINIIIGAETRFYLFDKCLHGLYLAPLLSVNLVHSILNIDDDIVVYSPTNHLEHTNYNVTNIYPVFMAGLHLGYKFCLGPIIICPYIGGFFNTSSLLSYDYGMEIGYGW